MFSPRDPLRLVRECNILVIDDDNDWLEICQNALKEENHCVECVKDRKNAITKLQENRFDLVILNAFLGPSCASSWLADCILLLDAIHAQGSSVLILTGAHERHKEVTNILLDLPFGYEEIVGILAKKNITNSTRLREIILRVLSSRERQVERPTIPLPSLPLSPPLEPRLITWLHLSDLHIGCKVEGRDWKSLKNALLKDIKDHQKAEQLKRCAGIVFRPDLILITGDIAYHGRQEEYEEAERFLKSLWEITELGEELGKERTFVVPGNHDLDREAVKSDPMYAAVYEQLSNNRRDTKSWLAAVESWWAYDLIRKLWERKFAHFLEFMNRCTAISTGLGYYVHRVDLSGIKVDIIGLNSALMSWKDDEDLERGLWIGKPQLDELECSLSDESLRIALVHHPHEALHPRDPAWERLQELSHLLLHGHMHELRIVPTWEPEKEHICLRGGSIHQDGIWQSQYYSYCRFNLETRELDLYLRRTKKGAYPLYIRDIETYPNAGAEGHIQVKPA